MEVLVEFDYNAQNIDELDIKKGDRLCNVVRKEEGWYEGILIKNGKIGKKGLFPDNFVKQIKSSPSFHKNLTQAAVNKSHKDSNLNVQNVKLQKNVPTSSPPPPPPPSILNNLHQQQIRQNIHNNPKPEKTSSPFGSNNSEKSQPSFMYKARVLYSYIPVNEDELAVQENEIVQVIRLVEDGWFEGICSGKQGVFPSNYVERIPSEPHSNKNESNEVEMTNEESFNEISEKDDKDKKKNSKKVFGIGFGNIFSGKTIELKTKENFMNQNNALAADLNQRQSDRLNERQIADSIQYPDIEKKETIKARVLYEYVPTQPDELHLVVGDYICILDKNLEDEGWYKGKSISTGEIGVFPDNFVEETADMNANDLISGEGIPNRDSSSKIIKESLSNEKNNRTNSMTNSLVSNSSSNNSLSKLAPVSKQAIQKVSIQLSVANTSPDKELNNSKSHSELSDDLEEFNNHSESSKLIHIKKTKQLNKRPPSFKKKKATEKDDSENLARSSPIVKPKQIETEDNISINQDSKREEVNSAISSKSTLSSIVSSTPTVIVSEPITVISSHHQQPSVGLMSKQASFLNAGTNSDLSVTTAVTTLDNLSQTQLGQNLAEDINFLKQELLAVRSENKLIRNELSTTKTQHENQIKKITRNFTDLINEIDEEKKTRLALQVELERLKKTIEVNNIFIG